MSRERSTNAKHYLDRQTELVHSLDPLPSRPVATGSALFGPMRLNNSTGVPKQLEKWGTKIPAPWTPILRNCLHKNLDDQEMKQFIEKQ